MSFCVGACVSARFCSPDGVRDRLLSATVGSDAALELELAAATAVDGWLAVGSARGAAVDTGMECDGRMESSDDSVGVDSE